MRCLGTATAQSSCIWKEGSLPLADAIIKSHFELAVHWICRNCGKHRYLAVTLALIHPLKCVFLPFVSLSELQPPNLGRPTSPIAPPIRPRYTSAPPHELPNPAAQL